LPDDTSEQENIAPPGEIPAGATLSASVQAEQHDIQEILTPVIPDPDVRSRVVAQVMQLRMHIGPLPAPEQLKIYAEVDKGAVPTIFRMAEREQQHRHSMNTLQMLYPYAGLVAGFLSFGICVAASVYLAVIGKTALAATFIGVTTLGVVALMIKGRISLPPIGTKKKEP
jgi:uncharacterized membrane protein